MGEWYYTDFTRQYINDEWNDLPEGNSQTCWGFETMFGYAITDRLEGHLHLPIAFKSKETPTSDNSSSGIGDIYLKGRYGVLPWAKDKHGLTLTGALRLGTGDDEASPALGDGTTDFALGAIFSSAWLSQFRGHLKANYWVNGETDDDVSIGNQLKVLGKIDYNLSPGVMPFLTYIYKSQAESEFSDGSTCNPETIRHYVVFGGVWKPKKGLSVRPKVVLPLGGENGRNFSIKPVLDLWYVFGI